MILLESMCPAPQSQSSKVTHRRGFLDQTSMCTKQDSRKKQLQVREVIDLCMVSGMIDPGSAICPSEF